LLIDLWLSKSKSQGRQFIKDGAIFVNEQKVEDVNLQIDEKLFLKNNSLLVRKWKKKYRLVLLK